MDVQNLFKIDEELKKSDVDALKFLCMDIIGRKHLEKVKDGKDLFQKLQDKDMFADKLFLPELLYTIGRYDLLRILKTNKNEISKLLKNQRRPKCGLSILDTSRDDVRPRSGVSPYRKMLYEISEDITDTILPKIKFLLKDLAKAKLSSATFLDILTDMEKMDMLGKDNLDELERVLEICCKDLAHKVRKFREKCEITEQDRMSKPDASDYHQEETSGHCRNIPIAETNPSSLSMEIESRLMTDSKGMMTTEESLENVENELYPMTRRPLGYCLIINNYNFEERTKYKNRNGTDADKDSLTRVFQRMNFVVIEKSDLFSSDILKVVEEFSKKDHSEMDAFVCCILSHGDNSSVLGIDGNPVLISELLQPFAGCATLKGKPKLFFIQACQGNKLQEGVWMHDGQDDECEENVHGSYLSSVPTEANFLIGKATVEFYKVFPPPRTGICLHPGAV